MTRGSDVRPTRRLLSGPAGEYAVELRESLILIRPKGARRNGGAEIVVTPGQVYVRAVMARVDAERREKRKLRRAHRGGK